MKSDDLKKMFANLKVWHGNGWRAPHKPLLALWAIGRCLREEQRLVPYDEVACEVGDLLRRFGPPRQRVSPDLPFWHLRRDGVWDVPEADRIIETVSGHAKVTSLRKEAARGGLPANVFQALQQDKLVAIEIAYSLVDAHFPETLQDDVLRAVGISADHAISTILDDRSHRPLTEGREYERVWRRSRKSAFATAVLDAYGERCAVCAFSIRMNSEPVALDAAHIKWHRAGGRDRDKVSNGISLCALHHRLFDAGAFTLSPKHTIITSRKAAGPGRDQYLEQYSQKKILLPKKTSDYPNWSSLKWHYREVFGPVVEGIDY